MQSLSQLFDQARQYHQAGNFYQAELLYRQILQIDPRHVNALHLLGLLAYQGGRSDLAVDFIRQALAVQPEFPAAHNNLGNILKALKKHDEATSHFQQALRQSPEYAEAYSNLGVNLKEQGKLDEAIASYQQALRLRPDYVEAYSNLGNALTAQGRFDEAIANFQQALRLRPGYPEAYSNMGNALQGQKKIEDALACYRQALRLKPGYVEALTNMGNALRANGQTEEGISAYKESLRLKPDNALAYSNMGNALTELGRFDEAIANFRQALRIQPEMADAHYNLSMQLLLQGNFAEGWEEYEWRWQSGAFLVNGRPSSLPQVWDGSPLQGRTILLHAEQGLGDAIQFIRYAELLKETGAGQVLLVCRPELSRLMARCRHIDQVLPQLPLRGYDVTAYLLSLPRLLGTTSVERIPAKVPYLSSDVGEAARWQARLAEPAGQRPALRVGINWQGNPDHKGDRWRSVPLEQFAPLAALPGVRLISLQKGYGSEQVAKWPGVAHHFGPELTDLADTAALLRCLDLVISVDTSLVHLAGALGVPVWVALPWVPDWRWLLQREHSPWYPTMRLFRQAGRGQWDDVFRRIKDALTSLR